jgi:sugar phosphate isomerase/epimerase/lysophospholipase L1-like esterase
MIGSVTTSSGRRLVWIALAGALTAPAWGATGNPIGYCNDDLEKTRAAGFDYGELAVRNFARLSDEDFARFLRKHDAAGLPTPTALVFLPNEMKIVGPAVDDKAAMAYVRTAFARARKLGVELIVFGSGPARKVPDGFSKDEAFRQLVAFSKRISPEAGKQGIVLGVEAQRKEETNLVNSVAEALTWVEAVDHPNFQLIVDFYHLAVEKEDPKILLKAAPHIKHIHFANPNGRVFPRSADEYDYSGFFENLRKIGYRGRISIEARTDDLPGDGPKAIAFLRGAMAAAPPNRPTVFLVGDSTVRNGKGDGANGQWGWGEPLAAFFDAARVDLVNRAIGGRSSRTFETEGRWGQVRDALKPGDVVIVQFGHNDGGELFKGNRPRATLKGTGDETEEGVVEMTGKPEIVHTYGWYLRKYVRETKARGAIAIVCSLVPRKIWKDGRIVRASEDYGKWAAEIAQSEGALFLDLNETIARRYDLLGPEGVDGLFADEHTHTNAAGAELSAACVAARLKALAEPALTALLSAKARDQTACAE